MAVREGAKAALSAHPPTETTVRKRYHLFELYRTRLLAKRREPRSDRLVAEELAGDPEADSVRRLAHELSIYIDEYKNGSLYNPPLHSAFGNFPAARKSGERYELVINNLDATEGRVLDVGCHIGAYFSSRLDDDGFDAVALDENVCHAHYSKRLTALRNPDVRVVWDSLFTWSGRTDDFDVVLGFNVFHHMLKEKRLFNRLKQWLRDVWTDEMVIQVPDQETPIWEGTYDWLTGEEWAELITELAGFDEVNCLGRPSNDRPMYHFKII
jgi:2-polyprenyl-3-methyl-5-hydroxy-6-metoxy-1,4-benzoquinol methylase